MDQPEVGAIGACPGGGSIRVGADNELIQLVVLKTNVLPAVATAVGPYPCPDEYGRNGPAPTVQLLAVPANVPL